MMNLSPLRSLSRSNTGDVKMHLQLYLHDSRPSCLNTGLLQRGIDGRDWWSLQHGARSVK